jgi:type II secretory pathway component PulK
VAFWQSPALKAISVPADAGEQVAVRSRFFWLEARVAGNGGEVGQSALLEARDGRVQPLRREWTIGG